MSGPRGSGGVVTGLCRLGGFAQVSVCSSEVELNVGGANGSRIMTRVVNSDCARKTFCGSTLLHGKCIPGLGLMKLESMGIRSRSSPLCAANRCSRKHGKTYVD